MNKRIEQIDPRDGHYIAGFTDGEGSFNVSFRPRKDYLLGWKITPVFNISQDEKDILAWIKHILACGTIRARKDGVWAYEVNNKQALIKRIVPFFERFAFRSTKKRRQFQNFKRILELRAKEPSMTLGTLKQIITARNQSRKPSRKRTYSNGEILQRAEYYWTINRDTIQGRNKNANKESSETNTPNA
uniref:Homing endonuclease LAGLIDADG domain-containing protein n=1 Tax=Pseudobryopsis hainanensis TaxID=2320808 RepID=A0A3S5X1K4_9CHLO|nr:hypothetical protein [Pseudobryopsis hainanensis]